MKEYNPNNHKIMIGQRVPPGAINTSFVDAPDAKSTECVRIFDRSKLIPENNHPIGNLSVDLYVDQNHLLSSESGRAMYPVRDIVLTDTYDYSADPAKDPIPLFYKYETRYHHYEVGTSPGQYDGGGIRILRGSTVVSEPYKIILTTENTDEYSIIVYTSFIGDSDTTYFIEYNKYDGDENPGYKEILNLQPIYSEHMIESQPQEDNIQDVIGGTAGDNKYAIGDAPNSQGYYFYVEDQGEEVSGRNPVLFRWRCVDNNSNVTPWKPEYLYNIDALQDEDYLSHTGEQIYYNHTINSSIVAMKLILNEIDAGTSSIEIQKWDTGTQEWVSDTGEAINLSDITPGDPLYAWTNENTGELDESSANYFKTYPDKKVNIKIKGDATEDPHTPPSSTEHIKSTSATSSWSNTGLFTNISNASRVLSLGEVTIAYTIKLPLYIWGRTPSVTLGDLNSQDDIELKIEFNNPVDINRLSFTLGQAGDVSKIEMVDSGNTVYTEDNWSPHHTQTNPRRRYYYRSIDTKSNITELTIFISPSARKTINYWGILNLFGIQDRYVGEFQVYSFSAQEYTPAQYNEVNDWYGETTIPVITSKATNYSELFYDILEREELIPPTAALKNICEYTIEVGDESDSISPYISLIHDGQEIYDATGSIHITYNDIDESSTTLVASVQEHEMNKSKQFTVDGSMSPRIKTVYGADKNKNEIWGLPIQNGSFYIRDHENKKNIQFRVPEFTTQPFYPAYPYIYVESEVAQFVDNNIISVSNTPLYVEGSPPTNIVVTINSVAIPSEEIIDWDINKGQIYLDKHIEFNDIITVSYVFVQQYYEYKGYDYKENPEDPEVFYHLDLNPLPGHVYTDMDSLEDKPSSELMDKAIYIYIVPSHIVYTDGSDEPVINDKSAIRHIIVNKDATEDNAMDAIEAMGHAGDLMDNVLILAKVLVAPKYTVDEATIIDTRQRGGGVASYVSREILERFGEEATYLWDIGSWDGHPYPSNGVIFVDLPESIRDEFGEEKVRDLVSKHIAYGVYPIIRYIT